MGPRHQRATRIWTPPQRSEVERLRAWGRMPDDCEEGDPPWVWTALGRSPIRNEEDACAGVRRNEQRRPSPAEECILHRRASSLQPSPLVD
ncbi:hypothetical protein MRX96_003710 [Rhipicephalus microplus]